MPMEYIRRFRRFGTALLAAGMAVTLSVTSLAEGTLYLLNGTVKKTPPASSSTGGMAERDSKGEGHSSTYYGISAITEEMRQNGPLYYSGKNSREAKAPEGPVPKDAGGITPSELAEKYHIAILDRAGYLKGPYGAQAVALIDGGLSRYSAEFVRSLVDKWAAEGRFFCINLYYPETQVAFKGATEINTNTVCINLCIPMGENPGGVSVNTVSHEFGHTIFAYLEKQMGEKNLARQWTALNGPYDYGSKSPERAKAFVSSYGSLYYYEDPATIFEAFADAPEITSQKLADKNYSLLKNKAEFLEQCIEKYIGTPGTLFTTVWNTINQPN